MRARRIEFISGRTWWWTYALSIALPAVALAVLGLRAARVERLEREQQFREQQVQMARLTDQALSAALGRLEGELARGEPASAALAELPVFTLDRSGLLQFPRDKLYFSDFARRPAAPAAGSAPAARRLVEQALAAEAQQRTRDAMPAYQSLMNGHPQLRPWAELGVARIRHQGGDGAALALLAKPEWSHVEAFTPTGLPVALLACAYVEQVAARQRAGFRPLLESTLTNLRAGRWWLSYEERRFHDGELRRLLAVAGAQSPLGDDARLEELAAIEHAARRALPRVQEGATRTFLAAQGGEGPFLLLWASAPREAGAWFGLALPPRPLAMLLNGVLTSLLSGQPFRAAVRDPAGKPVWSGLGESAIMQSVALRAVPGWELAFGKPQGGGSLEQRRLLWYGFILLLVVMMTVGLAMTGRVVQRELDLGRLQSDFLAAVTHEFKSPITSMRLLLERISGGRLRSPEAAAEYHAALARETDRLDWLVNRLLETTKIQAGQKRYFFQPSSIVAIAQAAVERLRPQAEARGIALDFAVQAEVPAADLDAAALGDAIENLVDNAIKYSPSGTRVEIRIQAEGGCLSVEVCDQGVGIDPGDLPRIFDRFYRGRLGNRESVKGTGIGLALVKAAAEAHGGSVEAHSARGQGSRFRLWLPLQGRGRHGANSDR